MEIPFESTEQAFGRIETDKFVYRPLDRVNVFVTGKKGGSKCKIKVCDPDQFCYFEKELTLKNNFAFTSFITGGKPGNHYIYLIWKDEERPYARYINFFLDGLTTIKSDDKDFDFLYPFTKDSMLRARRSFETKKGKIVGYISGDTWRFDGIWLRDWIYSLGAYKFWETEMTQGIDRFIENQAENGMIPDGIDKTGKTWRIGLESDVEYIFVLGVWQTWKTTGNHEWMKKCLPAIEKAMNFIMTDEKYWDKTYQLVKRQHSCDTWDFDIDGAGDKGTHRFVIANCDQSGYYLALKAISQMYRFLEKTKNADYWEDMAERYRERAAKLLWDGKKFLHHFHLDPIEHADFNENQQLSMGNTWAMTRKLATPEQSRRIIEEYKTRHEITRDAYPWWSLQPGYPDYLGYFKTRPFLRQGGYANGGLMPWVGGELCRACFFYGREKYAVNLLRQYVNHIRRTGGAHVWYWPDGTPGFRTTNEVNYTGWGMAQWIEALFEGLAGIVDDECSLKKVTVSPRWVAASVRNVYVCLRYGCSRDYFAYRMKIDYTKKKMQILCTGSGEKFVFKVLMPENWQPKRLTINGEICQFKTEIQDTSRYIVFPLENCGISRCNLEF